MTTMMDIAELDPAPKVTLSDRILRFLDSGLTQTFLGIIGGLTGTFLDGRCFVILSPLVPIALHRNNVLEGIDRPQLTIWYCISTSITIGLVLWFGIYLSKPRPDIFTPKDYASAVKGILPNTKIPEPAPGKVPSIPAKSGSHKTPQTAPPADPRMEVYTEAIDLADKIDNVGDDYNVQLEVERDKVRELSPEAAAREVPFMEGRMDQIREMERNRYTQKLMQPAIAVREKLLELVPDISPLLVANDGCPCVIRTSKQWSYL
jgi:hypothetical protein